MNLGHWLNPRNTSPIYRSTNAMALSVSQIGLALKEAREAAGLSQAQAAAALGVDAQTISRYERGERRARRPTLTLLAQLYKAPTAAFGLEANGLSNVPRGTAPAAVSRERGDALRDLRLVQNDVERHLIELGASDDLLAEASRLFVEIRQALRDLTEHAERGTVPESAAILARLSKEPQGDATALAAENEKPRTPGKAAGAKSPGRGRR